MLWVAALLVDRAAGVCEAVVLLGGGGGAVDWEAASAENGWAVDWAAVMGVQLVVPLLCHTGVNCVVTVKVRPPRFPQDMGLSMHSG